MCLFARYSEYLLYFSLGSKCLMVKIKSPYSILDYCSFLLVKHILRHTPFAVHLPLISLRHRQSHPGVPMLRFLCLLLLQRLVHLVKAAAFLVSHFSRFPIQCLIGVQPSRLQVFMQRIKPALVADLRLSGIPRLRPLFRIQRTMQKNWKSSKVQRNPSHMIVP